MTGAGTYLVLFGALAVMTFATVGNPVTAIEDLADRGRQLTRLTVDSRGVVADSPADVAAQASAVLGREVSEDAISLALMARSEGGSEGQISKGYRCHVAMNQAAALGWGLVRYVTFHKTEFRADRYGRQISGRVASDEDCFESDLTVAEFSIDQNARGEDPTAGAVNFADVGAFGIQLGTSSFARTRAEWEAEGKVFGTLPGARAGLVFAWRRVLPSIAEALA